MRNIFNQIRVFDCKTTKQKINDFLLGNLDPGNLKSFLQHVENCPDCKEELSIQFLVTEGLNTLETGNSYDLQHEYDERIAKSWRNINVHKKLLWGRNIAILFVILALVVCIVAFYMLFFR